MEEKEKGKKMERKEKKKMQIYQLSTEYKVMWLRNVSVTEEFFPGSLEVAMCNI